MLYGMSFLYGLTGTMDITSTVFAVELAKNSGFVVAVVSLLTLAGFLFKLSLVPFHIWTPDGDVQVALADLRVIKGRIRTQDYEVAMRWVRGNIDFVRSEWDRLNG